MPYMCWIEKKKDFLRTGSKITISLDEELLGHLGRACLTPNVLKINYLTVTEMCISKYRCGDTIPIELIFERKLRLRDLISQNAPTSNQSVNTVDCSEIPRTTSIPALAKHQIPGPSTHTHTDTHTRAHTHTHMHTHTHKLPPPPPLLPPQHNTKQRQILVESMYG